MRVTSAGILEYQELKELLGRYLTSSLGAAELANVAPLSHRARLEEIFADTAEAIAHELALDRPQKAARGAAIPVRFSAIPDCREWLAKLRIEGAVLDAKELLAAAALLESAAAVKSALEFSAETFPRLALRASSLGEFRAFLRDLALKILPDGAVADEASPTLSRLRRDRERQQRRIQESLERFLRAHRQDGILQEEFVTIRNDRFVIPIVAGQQRRIEGVIHGASGTGHTLFVEPFDTIELNNELVRLAEEEAREVHRILREITDELRGMLDSIDATVRALGELEYLFAKARFARDFGAVIPRFSPPEARRLLLRDARHPLLEDVLRRQHRPVVPVSLELAGDQRTLLISGPNTGGKTVTLKTVGLLALMAQSGMPVPCAEAELPLFEEVLADIGDNQSIQESLSTFSAHIARVRRMLDQVSPDSLVLLDELGRATDPEEGGALGVAIVEEFRRAGAFVLASTHLLALKIYGANTPGVLNASMGFDDATLQPTYRLAVGAPGKSAGLDIARRIGLPAPIIERARARMGARTRDIAEFLNQLHRRLDEVARLRREVDERRQALAQSQRTLVEDWRRRRQAKLAELERHAGAAVRDFEARAQEVIEEIRRQAAGRREVSKARQKVARVRREFEERLEAEVLKPPAGAAPPGRIAEGATVRLRGLREPGRVRRFLSDELIEVEAGFLKLHVPVDDVLEVLSETARPHRPAHVGVEAGPRLYFSTREINVIGKRAEEACREVDKFLDDAVLASVDQVRIVHGHGMGVLRKAIAEMLERHPHVERFYPAPPAEGGAGATIAELKS